MDLEEGMVRKIVVATAAVVGFLALIVLIGITWGGSGGLTPTGGLALVGGVILFILVMAGVGVYLDQ